MDAPATPKLTPDEAGAFVALWSETHPLTAEELGKKLGIDRVALDSLRNQSQGRLVTANWTSQTRPERHRVSGPMTATLAVGSFLVGALIVAIAFPRHVHVASGAELTAAYNVAPHPGLGFQPIPGPGFGGAAVMVPPTAFHQMGFGGGSGSDGRAPKFPTSKVHIYTVNEGGSSGNVLIPSDIQLSLRTPNGMFISNGRSSGNGVAAQSLNVANLLPALRELAQFANRTDPPSASKPDPKNSSAMLVMRLGWATAGVSLKWDSANANAIENLFAERASKGTEAMVEPFLDKIRKLGKGLFSGTAPADAVPSSPKMPISGARAGATK